MGAHNPSKQQYISPEILQNVSNGRRRSSRYLAQACQSKTPVGASPKAHGYHTAPAQKFNPSVRRQISKSYGDISSIRPKSPPIYNLYPDLQGDSGDSIESRCFPLAHSPIRNNRRRIPNDWTNRDGDTHLLEPSSGPAEISPKLVNQAHIRGQPEQFGINPIAINGLNVGVFNCLDKGIPIVRDFSNAEKNMSGTLLSDSPSWTPIIEHIDVSTVWHGLNFSESQELSRIHHAFITTLEGMLADELWAIYGQLWQKKNARQVVPHDDPSSHVNIRGISFCREQLVGEMADMLYSSRENSEEARSGLFRLYLAASNCLVKYHGEESRDTSITVRVSHQGEFANSRPVVEALWAPDYIIFGTLDKPPREGKEIWLVPRYRSNSVFASTDSPENVTYSIESQYPSSRWLFWDSEIGGFRGILPFLSVSERSRDDGTALQGDYGTAIRTTYTIRMIVKAIIANDNGLGICSERIVRAGLWLKVIPGYPKPQAYEPNVLLSRKILDQVPKQSPIDQAYADYRSSACPNFLNAVDISHKPYARGHEVHQTPHPYDHGFQTASFTFRESYQHRVARSLINTHKYANLGIPGVAHKEICPKAGLQKEYDIWDKLRNGHAWQLDAPDLQVFSATLDAPSYSSDSTLVDPPTYWSSESPRASDNTCEILTTPPTPRIKERRLSKPSHIEDERFEPCGTFSPPTLHLRPSQTFSSDSQAWNRIHTPHGTPLSCNGGSTFNRATASASVDVPVGFMSPDLERSRPENTNLTHAHAPQTPSSVLKLRSSASTEAPGSRKRYTRSSPSITSPTKRIKDNRNKASRSHRKDAAHSEVIEPIKVEPEAKETPTQDDTSCVATSNPFSPLRDLISPSVQSNDVDSVLASAGLGPADSGSEKDAGHSIHVKKRVVERSNDSGYATDKLTSSHASDSREPSCQAQSRLSISMRSESTASTSRKPSTECDILTEHKTEVDNVSRREQAQKWASSSLSNSESEGRPTKEVRLGSDEKRAFDEAIRRSLQTVTETFEDIFLEDDTETESKSD